MRLHASGHFRRCIIVLIVLFIASLFVLPATPAFASSLQLTGAIAPQQSDVGAGLPTNYVFKTVNVPFSYTSGQFVIFSGCQDQSCTWAIDDKASLKVTHADGSIALEEFDSYTVSMQAKDITYLFEPGTNQVEFKLIDKVGPQRGSEDLWLVQNTTAPPTPSLDSEIIPDRVVFTHNPYVSYRGDPVNSLTGSFSYQSADISLAGRGPVPGFMRSYDSGDTRVGTMGPGWTHNYMMRLVQPYTTTNDIAVISPEGRADLYTYNSGSYVAPAGVSGSLVKNSDGTYTLTGPDQSAWYFDETGRFIRLTDRFGNYSTLTYTNDQLTSVSDPAGRGNLSFSYNSSGLLTSVTDWISRTVTFGYDSNNRLATVTDRTNNTTTYSYDGSTSRIASITDANNVTVVALTYDSEARVATQKDARGLITGQQTTFSYVTNGDGTKTTAVTHPQTSHDSSWNFTEVDTYDAQGRLTSYVAKPVSASNEWITETYTYDTAGNRDSYTDGRGNTTNYCYDVDYTGSAISGSRGNLTRVIAAPPTTGANRPVTLFKYDNKNNLIETIPPKGVSSGTSVTCTTNLSASINTLYVTTYTYDSTQTKLVSEAHSYTDPDLGQQTATTKYEYGDSANPGLVTKVIPPRGNTTSTPDYTYAVTNTYVASGTDAGMLSQVATPAGTTTYDYDAVGRMISMVEPRGNVSGATPAHFTIEYVYDNEDRQRYVKLPAPISGGSQLVTEYRYDNVGNNTVIIDANGQVTRRTYDERDQLKEVHQSPNTWTDPATNPSGMITTEYQYDHLGNLSRMTRAKSDSTYERATDYTYDGLGRVRKETQYPSWPSTSTTLLTTYTYDKNSNRASMTDPLNQTTTFSYDALNRLTNITYNSATTPNVTYAYDINNNRISMADTLGSTTYTTTYTYDEANRLMSVTSGVPANKTVGYRYDLDGNRRKLIYPDNTEVTYTFDTANRLLTLVDWSNRTTSYTYLVNGAVSQQSNFNGTSGHYTYDNTGRLTQVWNMYGSDTITQHSYTMDAAGNRTHADEVFVDGSTPGTISSGRQGTIDYTYDRMYRLTQEHRDLPSLSGGETISGYTYDPVGNRLTYAFTKPPFNPKTTSYSYDRADRILNASGENAESFVVNANGNLTNRGGTFGLNHAYDQANRLIVADPFSTGIFYHYYDGDGKRTKIANNSTVLDTFVYDVNQRLPLLLQDGTRKYVWGLGLAYTVNGSNAPLVYHTDGLGSVRAMTDNRLPNPPWIQMDENYEAFGNETAFGSSTGNLFKFAGEQKDERSSYDTGYYYLRARYYDPVIGRFISRDTTFGQTNSPLTLNRYSYVENNPVNGVDPSGHATNRALTGVKPSIIPPNVDLYANMMEASKHKGDYNWFKNMVCGGCPWDYKKYDSDYEEFGNFHYGVVGQAAGFSEELLLVMAGVVQIGSNVLTMMKHTDIVSYPGTGMDPQFYVNPEGLRLAPMDLPYGDDSRDQFWINQGYNFASNPYSGPTN